MTEEENSTLCFDPYRNFNQTECCCLKYIKSTIILSYMEYFPIEIINFRSADLNFLLVIMIGNSPRIMNSKRRASLQRSLSACFSKLLIVQHWNCLASRWLFERISITLSYLTQNKKKKKKKKDVRGNTYSISFFFY